MDGCKNTCWLPDCLPGSGWKLEFATGTVCASQFKTSTSQALIKNTIAHVSQSTIDFF